MKIFLMQKYVCFATVKFKLQRKSYKRVVTLLHKYKYKN